MPLFVFACPSCGERFEELAPSLEAVTATAVRCPKCGAAAERQLSRAHVGSRSRAPSSEPFCGRCGENRPPCSA